MTEDQLDTILTLEHITREAVSRVLGTPIDDITQFLTLRQDRHTIGKIHDADIAQKDTDELLARVSPNPAVYHKYKIYNG